MRPIKKFFDYLRKGHSPIWHLRKLWYNCANFREFRRRKHWIETKKSPRHAAELSRNGFTFVSGIDPSGIVEYCTKLCGTIDPTDSPPKPNCGKDFWKILISSDNIDEHSLIKDFAQNIVFEDIASHYLGTKAVLSNVSLMKSYPTETEPKHSQTWHLDADDSRLVVFYVYINDVTADNGPFEFLPKAAIKKFYTPRFFRKHSFSDEELVLINNRHMDFSITGRAGTMFACDTASYYHRGSRCKSTTRIALSIRYSTFSGLYPVTEIT